mgnify:FL=1
MLHDLAKRDKAEMNFTDRLHVKNNAIRYFWFCVFVN